MSHREQDDPSTHDTDATIDRAWREASAEAPPPGVDARILAAAREAVALRDPDSRRERTAGPLSHARWTWRPLLAAAAVGGIAFAMLPTLLRHADTPLPDQPGRTVKAPAPSQAPTSEAQPTHITTPPPSAAAADASASAPAAMPVERESRAVGTPDESAPPRSAESAENASASSGIAAGRDLVKRADRPAPAALAAPPTPADRAARISDLYRSGDLAGAAAELRSFRATQPDADSYLPSALQPWARSVK